VRADLRAAAVHLGAPLDVGLGPCPTLPWRYAGVAEGGHSHVRSGNAEASGRVRLASLEELRGRRRLARGRVLFFDLDPHLSVCQSLLHRQRGSAARAPAGLDASRDTQVVPLGRRAHRSSLPSARADLRSLRRPLSPMPGPSSPLPGSSGTYTLHLRYPVLLHFSSPCSRAMFLAVRPPLPSSRTLLLRPVRTHHQRRLRECLKRLRVGFEGGVLLDLDLAHGSS